MTEDAKVPPAVRSDWLLTTINAVRELMVQRLEKRSLDADTEREVQMALEEIEVMWEELLGQADLLSREHKRYQEFFEFSPDAYAVSDPGGNVREANRALAEALGVVRADLLGKPLMRWVVDSERVRFLENFIDVGQHGTEKPRTWRTRLQPSEGPALEFTVSVRAMPLHKSGATGLCWLFRRD
jgi:PAS domain S-box-containing protein